MPQKRYTDADLKPKPIVEDNDLEPLSDNQDNDLEPIGWDTVDLRDHRTPYTGSPNRLPVQGPEDESIGQSIWKEVNRPHLDLTPYSNALSKKITDIALSNRGMENAPDWLKKVRAISGGGLAGLVEGAGNLGTEATSDLGILSMLLPEERLAKAGMPAAAETMQTLRRLGSAPFALHGGEKVIDPNSTLEERGTGLAEAAGGILGFLHHTPYSELAKEAKLKDIPPPTNPPNEPTQPNLDFNLPDFHQPSLFDERVPSGPPRQLQLTDEIRPEPNKQGTLDFAFEHPGLSNRFRNEFSPIDEPMRGPLPNPPQSLFHETNEAVAKERPQLQNIPEQTPEIQEGTNLFEGVPPELLQKFRDSLTNPKTEHTIPESEDMGRAHFAFDWPEIGKMYNVEGGPHHGSTLSEESLNEYGIPYDKAPDPLNEDEQPLFSRSEKGGIKVGVNIQHAANELTTGYSRELPAIMVREAFQNAKDAIHHLGSGGKIHAELNDDGFTITDNGKGMDRQELETVFSDLHSSGKATDENATGGKGIGKATYMLGGQHFEVVSVKDVNGKKIEYSMSGTPDEFMEHVDVHEKEVPSDTPTGTKITTKFTPQQIKNSAGYHARNMYEDIISHSRDLQGNATKGAYHSAEDLNPFKQTGEDTQIGQINIGNNDITVHIPKETKLEENSSIGVHYLNNGMYQYSKYHYLGNPVVNIPNDLIINLKPSVAEGTPEYPFPTQRESLKDTIQEKVDKYINDVLVNPQKAKQKNYTQQLYDSMISKDLGGVRNSIIFDPGNRLTPHEREIVENNHVMQQVNKFFDRIADEALKAVGRNEWSNKLEGIGTMFSEPGLFGIHVPNPSTKKSSIMVNFLNHVNDNQNNPSQAAWDTVSTLFHELGHVGNRDTTTLGKLDLTPEEMNHPRLGEFMKMYLENVQHGANTSNFGHSTDWLARTAEIMTKYGPSKTIGAVDELTNIFTNGNKAGGYNGQTQSLFQLAQERMGRPETTPDFLSPTGIKSESTGGRAQNSTGGNSTDSVGTTTRNSGQRPVNTGKKLTAEFNKPIRYEQTTPEAVKKVQEDIPQNEIPKRISNITKHATEALNSKGITKDEKESLIEKVINLNRTLLTSYDLSALGNQGFPLIHRKEWWGSLDDMFKALGSEKGYNTVMDSIKQDPSGLFASGDSGKSFANEAGLELTDALSHREEIFRSKLAEDYFPGVRPTVRAYTAFLNKLRADTFKNMVKVAKAENNLPDAKAIADFINVATGRGKLKGKVFGAKIDLEGSAETLAQIFFSPRRTASRLQMYTRTFNPKYYASVPKVVRENQLRSALSVAGVGLLMGRLSKMAGATVSNDPYNSDFGKIRIGNTRIDPFSGHQQFLVAAARLIAGKATSSTNNKTYDLTHPHFGGPTRADIAGRFISNKLAPVPSFVWSWMQGREFDGTPWDMKKELAQRTVPIVMQDLYDIWKDDPTLVPSTIVPSLASIGGMGVQSYGR